MAECLKDTTALLGDWEWHNGNSPTSPKGEFAFNSELSNNVVTIRASRVYPGKGPEFQEMFVIYRDTDKKMRRSIYFDDHGRSSQCEVETQSNRWVTLKLTCRADQVHMRYVFGCRDGKPYFQLQLPPPHRFAEFVPYLVGFLEHRKKRKD